MWAARPREGDAGDDEDEDEDVGAERVDDDQAVERAQRSVHEDEDRETDPGDDRRAEPGQRDPGRPPGVGEPGREAGHDRCDDDEEDEQLGHPRRLRSSSVEVLPNTSSIRRA